MFGNIVDKVEFKTTLLPFMIAKKGHEMLMRFVYACAVCMYGVCTLV